MRVRVCCGGGGGNGQVRRQWSSFSTLLGPEGSGWSGRVVVVLRGAGCGGCPGRVGWFWSPGPLRSVVVVRGDRCRVEPFAAVRLGCSVACGAWCGCRVGAAAGRRREGHRDRP